MKSDTQLQQDVVAKFKSDAILYADQIGVSAKNGLITLSGTVDSYDKKSEAADSAKEVDGVQAVIEHLDVSNSGDPTGSDDTINFSRSNPMNY